MAPPQLQTRIHGTLWNCLESITRVDVRSRYAISNVTCHSHHPRHYLFPAEMHVARDKIQIPTHSKQNAYFHFHFHFVWILSCLACSNLCHATGNCSQTIWQHGVDRAVPLPCPGPSPSTTVWHPQISVHAQRRKIWLLGEKESNEKETKRNWTNLEIIDIIYCIWCTYLWMWCSLSLKLQHESSKIYYVML